MIMMRKWIAFGARRPLVFTIVNASTIGGSADLTCQLLTSYLQPQSFVENFQKDRVGRMALLRAAYIAPLSFGWFTKGITLIFPCTSSMGNGVLLSKALYNEMVYAPWLSMGCIYLLEKMKMPDKSHSECMQVIKENLPMVLQASMSFWLGWNFLSFKYMPLIYQPSFNFIGAFFWCTWLSYKINN
jgi:hypothetical protein